MSSLLLCFLVKAIKFMKKLMCDIAKQKIEACCHKLHDATFPDFELCPVSKSARIFHGY